jgi:hypothetical protein
MPSAITMMKLFCWTRLLRLTGLNRVPVVNWKNTMMAISARMSPYSRRFETNDETGTRVPVETSWATPVCGVGAVSVLMLLFLLRARWRA